jgi:hypothetical protein
MLDVVVTLVCGGAVAAPSAAAYLAERGNARQAKAASGGSADRARRSAPD